MLDTAIILILAKVYRNYPLKVMIPHASHPYDNISMTIATQPPSPQKFEIFVSLPVAAFSALPVLHTQVAHQDAHGHHFPAPDAADVHLYGARLACTPGVRVLTGPVIGEVTANSAVSSWIDGYHSVTAHAVARVSSCFCEMQHRNWRHSYAAELARTILL